MKIQNYKSQQSASKANYISAYKFFSALFGPMHCMFHHCSNLDLQAFTWSLIFFLYLFVYLFLLIEYHNKQNEQTE